MLLCADENVPGLCINELRTRGHDVVWILEVAPGSDDRQVLAMAQGEKRLLLTFDKDFGELAFREGVDSVAGVVLFRIPMSAPVSVAKLMADILESREDWEGHFSVVEEASVRMRPLPTS